MKYTVIFILFLAVFFTINFLPPQRYTYTGIVLDELKQPIAAAKLSFYFKGVDEVTKEVETNVQGEFSLTSHYQQLEKVVVVKDNYHFFVENTQENNRTVFNVVGKKR